MLLHVAVVFFFLTCEIIICVYTTINGPILLLMGIYVTSSEFLWVYS